MRTLCHQINESPYRPRCKHRNLYSLLIDDYAILIELFIMENMESSFTQRTAHWEYKAAYQYWLRKNFTYLLQKLEVFHGSRSSLQIFGYVEHCLNGLGLVMIWDSGARHSKRLATWTGSLNFNIGVLMTLRRQLLLSHYIIIYVKPLRLNFF